MYKIYDVDENIYVDIRNQSGCTIDSNNFYDKMTKTRFSVLSKSKTVVNKLWSKFWQSKDKSNN